MTVVEGWLLYSGGRCTQVVDVYRGHRCRDNAIHFKIPQYLCNLLAIKENKRYSIRSASNGLLLEDKTCKFKVTLGERSLGASAARTWNTLPKEIRDQMDVRSFKTMLKTHFIKIAYSNFL